MSSTVTIQKEIELDCLIDMILNDGNDTNDILACLDDDEIKDYLEGQGYSVVNENKEKDVEEPLSRSDIIRIVRHKTRLYPDKKTVMTTLKEIVDELW